MTSMRRRYVASTSLRRHVPTGNLAPPCPPPPQNSKPWPPQYSKPSYAYESDKVNLSKTLFDSPPEIFLNNAGEKHLVETGRKKIMTFDCKISLKTSYKTVRSETVKIFSDSLKSRWKQNFIKARQTGHETETI